jgi:high-affinity nickel-transport protein
MLLTGAFTVFALGMRHGADPDHLAAIDNLTRNSYERRPRLSRWVGALFASGHSLMVLAIAAFVGAFGARLGAHRDAIETSATWLSIAVLLIIATLNLRALADPSATGAKGLRARLVPRVLRNSNNPLVAVVVGLLFGFGFETSSQVATYALALGVQAGAAGALLIGAAFCAGMIVTDAFDSILVHRLVSHRVSRAAYTVRVWIWSVTVMALVVAAYECAQVLGWQSPVPDAAVSGALVAALAVVFAYVFALTPPPPQRETPLPGR